MSYACPDADVSSAEQQRSRFRTTLWVLFMILAAAPFAIVSYFGATWWWQLSKANFVFDSAIERSIAPRSFAASIDLSPTQHMASVIVASAYDPGHGLPLTQYGCRFTPHGAFSPYVAFNERSTGIGAGYKSEIHDLGFTGDNAGARVSFCKSLAPIAVEAGQKYVTLGLWPSVPGYVFE